MPLHSDIFRHLDVSTWLGAEFDARSESDASLTQRRFSELCGYKSSGALSLIVSGRRRISRAAGDRISKALGLEPAEKSHLRRMIDFSLTEDFEERAALLRKMSATQRFANEWKGTVDAAAFYRTWTLPVLRELTSLPDFREDPEWLSERLHHEIRPQDAAAALAELKQLGYLQRDPDGRLRATNPIVATPAELKSDALKHHQREMMSLAGDALDSQTRERRDMRVMTVAISENQASKLKAMLTQFHMEVLDMISEDEPIEVVYQMNTQLFALTNPADTQEEAVTHREDS